MGTVVYGSGYPRTLLGILKICEIITCLVGLILVLVGGTWTNSLVDAFYAGTVIAIIVSVLLLIICTTGSSQSVLSVLKHQYIIGGILFIYLLVVSAIMTDRYYTKYHRVGGIFGLVASVCYLIDTGMTYRAYYM